MDIFRILGLGLVGTIMVQFIRQEKPELALLLSLVVGITILGMVLEQIREIISVLQNLATQAGLNMVYIATIIRIMGIAYVAEFGVQICRDAGEGVMANKIELGAKVMIMALALPIFLALLETLLSLIH